MRVDDSASRVRCFATQLEVSARLEIEVRAGRCKLTHSRRPFFNENFHCLRITQCSARGKCVLSVQLR